MKLARIRVGGYRSIGEPMDLDFDGRVTVILGANDHGKTNLLASVLHMNPDAPFTEGDLNWDYSGQEGDFPFVHYSVHLSEEERGELLHRELTRITTKSYAGFRQALERDAAATEAKAEKGQAEADASEGTSTEDASSAPSGDERGEQSSADPSHITDLTDKDPSEVDLARLRVALARAEELKVLAQLSGDQPFDLVVACEQAEQAAAEAGDRHTTAREEASRAQEAVSEAESTHGGGSEELAAAQAAAKAATDVLGKAREEADVLAVKAQDLRRAADASALAEEGNLDFGPGRRSPKFPALRLKDIPSLVTVGRTGLGGDLTTVDSGILDPAETMDYLHNRLPRIELFEPQASIPDIATAKNIDAPDNDFMRGIFRYAGLTPAEWGSLFEQTDTSTMRLAIANEHLNQTLRTAWTQGRDLQFELDHRQGEIDLKIKDPAVKSTFVRASRRSSGFTHFFALKTMLFAREQASQASSFVWLFDEPGMYLHPDGQHDLLQVLETLGQTNQIAYSTHSIFLFNKNHPVRHRLLKKDSRGTSVDQKPFVGRWRPAIDALGLALPGTILFASKILLVEGDSDPILLNADFQTLIELGDLAVDINPLSIIATGDGKHADALVRILLEAAERPTIGLLFDGDDGGAERLRRIEPLAKAKGLKTHQLPRGTTAEDHVVSPEAYREATIRYVERIATRSSNVRASLEQSYSERFAEPTPAGLAEWARTEGKAAGGLDQPPSAVGIAREYSAILAETDEPPNKKTRKRALELADTISKMVGLREQTVEQELILGEA